MAGIDIKKEFTLQVERITEPFQVWTFDNDILSDGFSRSMRLSTEDRYEYSTMSMSLKPNKELFGLLIRNHEKLLVKVLSGGNIYFMGYVRNTGSYTIEDKLKPFSIELVDAMVILDDVATEDMVYRETTLGAILKDIIGAPLSNLQLNNTTPIDFLIIKEGEKKIDVIGKLLYEFGLA